MTISRGQMNRQLYMGGGIMNAVPREQYGLGSVFKGVKKAVKGATKTVKKIASSDLGKAAITAAAIYYAPAMFGGTAGFGAGSTYGNFARGLMSPNLIGPMTKAGGIGRSISSALTGKAGVGLGIAALGGIFGGAMAGKSEEEVQALTRDVPALKSYLTQYYTNLNPELRNQPEKVEEFVNSQIAEYNEGRGGYAMGGRMQYSDGTMSPDEYFSGKEKYMKEKQMEDMIREYERYMRDKNMNRDEVAMGGRIGYQQGSMMGINTDKLKEDASGILDILLKNTPFGVAKMMAEKTQGNEAQIKNFIKNLLKKTPPGQVINFIADRYKIPESIASRMVVNQLADANMPIDPSGSTDEGFPSRPEFESSAEDTSVMPIKNRFTQEELENMADRLRNMDPSDMPSIPLPEGRFEDDGLYDNEKKYYPNTYDPEPRYLNQGGRIGYALGDTASQNAMQAAGIEGLPMRQNPKGVQELDLRDNGGFIPPVGIKEKEDDIPAMLSNNEFVFTADAVRGMGDGDVELGAQRMYDQMKTLEEGGRV